jgi:uncharacterized PurR-regulated membrane protein YhhQ (DUF165 family)
VWIVFAGFVGTVWAANWALDTYGFVSVGFGLTAPAGVYFAGLAFSLRDWLHELSGKRAVVAAIITGAILSWWIEPTFAVASGTAFLASETADFLIYTPLRERNRYAAIALSNTVGAVVDSAIFLWLAFDSLTGMTGLVVGKTWITLATVLLVAAFRRSRAAAHR